MRGGQASRIQRPFQDPAVAFGAVAAALQEGIQLCRGSVLPEDAEGGRGSRALHQRLHPGDRLLESIAVRGPLESDSSVRAARESRRTLEVEALYISPGKWPPRSDERHGQSRPGQGPGAAGCRAVPAA